jgi:hypothetical protein
MSDDPGVVNPPNPSDGAPSGATGLLDIKVQLSTPSPTAGSEFTVYVLVTNLFDRPIYPESPQVFLPSELRPAKVSLSPQESISSMSALLNQIADGEIPDSIQPERRRLFSKLFKPDDIKEQLKYMAQKAIELDQRIDELEKKRRELQTQINDATAGKPMSERIQLLKEDPTISGLANEDTEYARQITETTQRSTTLKTQITNLTGATAVVTENDLKLSNFSFTGRMYIQAKGDVQLESATSPSLQALDSSSLRPGDALQPGSTAVYSLILTTKNSLLFRPVQYALQYSLNFSFNLERKKIFTNTASQQITIRSPIVSVMFGAVLGGIAGFLATFLTKTSQASAGFAINWAELLISLVVTSILSAMAVVFLVRKTETQSLISVEDFWGGLVIGFLVGYAGTTAFESLTGFSALSGVSTTPIP